MHTLIQRGRKVLVALILTLVFLASGALIAPQVHASSRSMPPQPYYILCSRLGRTVTHYGPTYTQNLGGDSAQPSIQAWYDSVQSSTVCQEQAAVLWTTSRCSSRTVTVGFTNGVGGNNSSTLKCGTLTYKSNVTYADACAFYMSATTSDSYQVNWSYSPFC